VPATSIDRQCGSSQQALHFAAQAVTALRAKKHVYLQKPLTHHLHEARILSAEAAKAGVTTQMGTQGHSSIETSLTVDLIKSGAIGKVREVICWENKKASWWPKVTERKAQADPVPEHIDWNLWLGPAPWEPYNERRCDGNFGTNGNSWRSYYDYSGGSLTDWGAHHFGGAIFAGILAAYASTGAWPVTAAVGDQAPRQSTSPPIVAPSRSWSRHWSTRARRATAADARQEPLTPMRST
jgi:hypothetical protein